MVTEVKALATIYYLNFRKVGHTFPAMGKQDAPIDASAVTPREVVDAYMGHPGLIRSEMILNRFLGLGVSASGRIVCEDKIGFGLDYVTAGIDDQGVLVLCNFEKPVPPDVAALKKGEQIRVHGIIENANKDIVVLTSCRLENEISKPDL